MTSVGRYQILEPIGRGAMGVVYKAYDPTIGRTVAIKAIRLSEFADAEEQARVRTRLLREAQSAGLLSHPSIVTIYDVLEEQNSAYIFMEYVRGSSLQALLRDNQLPPTPELLLYLRQVAEALDYAHRRGVIHRDVKPANILLSEPDDRNAKLAKVTDFGVAKFISQDTTHSGTMMGTPSYMSPEQIQALGSDGRADQFSLAIVIYELLTGAKPFAGEGLATLLYQICKADSKPANQVNAALPEAAATVIARALAKDPSERFHTCAEFVGALSEAIQVRSIAAAAAAPIGLNGRHVDATLSAGPPISISDQDAIETEEQQSPLSLPSAVKSEIETEEAPSIEESATVPLPEAEPAVPLLSPLPRRRAWQDTTTAPQRNLPWRAAGLLLGCGAIALALWVWRGSLQPQAVGRQSEAVAPGAPAQADSGKLQTTSTGRRQPLPSSVPAPVPPSSGAATRPPMEKPLTPAYAEATFVTEPSGANVVVDEQPDRSCVAPCNLRMPPGRHTLTAALPGYNLARRVFQLPADDDVNISLEKMTGVLVITSAPSGSQVLVDGTPHGNTPATLRLTPGPHQLVLINGPQRHEETVTVQNDGFEARSFRW